ncbi:3-oxoacyl-[acyl-carrier-protein] synthase III C-terminal domain-containing protein [Streptomyces sp. NPDC020192]|uniref:3-oxoacyl-[acyl-carrier-protein] synthase III C-terminal domain-containing protein n=1 Tax=Streptomyces sp. NPDC020192 TaxID=3365066 RepID=UPI003792AF91
MRPPAESSAFVIGSAVVLPAAVVSAAGAVRAGRITEEERARLDVTSVHVGAEPAPVLAAAAARAAAAEAGVEPDRVGHLMHAHIYYQGHDFWSPAHFIAHEAGFEQCVPMSVGQMCNGGAAALGIGIERVRRTVPGEPVLSVVTTADTFGGTGFDRWGGDYDTVYGDGATCVILSPEADGTRVPSLRLVALDSRARPQFEAMYREGDPFGTTPHALRPTIDVKATKRAFFERSGGTAAFRDAAVKTIGELVAGVLDTAGVGTDDVAATMLPRLSPKVLDLMYRDAIDPRLVPTLHCERDTTGHLGAGDFLANLDHLRRTDLLADGQYALVVGGGGGFTWSAALVQKVGPSAPRT